MQILIENILVRAYYESSIIGEALANGSVRWGRFGLLVLRHVKSHADGYRLVSNGLGHHDVDACCWCCWRKPIRNVAVSALWCVPSWLSAHAMRRSVGGDLLVGNVPLVSCSPNLV